MKIKADFKCPRCHQEHGELEYFRLTHPSKMFTHWYMCPKMKEPALLIFDSRPKSQNNKKTLAQWAGLYWLWKNG